MGCYATATLFWGFASDDEEEPLLSRPEPGDDGEEDDPPDWEDIYAVRMGIPRPVAEYGPESEADYHVFWDRRREVVGKCACKVGRYGHYDFEKEYTCIKASENSATQSRPSDVGPLEVKPEWEGQLRAFCETMGIAWREPGWKMVAFYG